MGASQSEPFSQELAGYKVIQRYPENNITHLSHLETDKEYLLREHTYNDENLYQKSYNEHKKRQSIVDDHLTHLGRVQGKQIDQLCSNIYKIYAIWEYPYRFLSDEINQRSYQNRKFEDKQIWSILASAILGLSTLQKNKIKHEMLTTKSILLDTDGLIKIADPLACGSTSNMDTIYRNRNTQGIYLSPQQCQALQSRGSYNNSYKNDVWTIGMILLECGLLRNLSDCYKDEYQRIDFDKINKNLGEFGQQYGQDLRIIVQLMLKKDNKDRPDWIDLQPYARKTNRSPNAQNINSNMNMNTNANISLSPLSSKQQQQSSFSPYIPISNNKQSRPEYNGQIKQQSFDNKDSFRSQPKPIIYPNQSFSNIGQQPLYNNQNLNINTNISSLQQSYGYAPILSNTIQTPTFNGNNSILGSIKSMGNVGSANLTASIPYQPVSTSSFGYQPPLFRPTQYSNTSYDRMSNINRGNLFPNPTATTPISTYTTTLQQTNKTYQSWKNAQQQPTTSLSYQSYMPLNTNKTTSIPYMASNPLRPDFIKTSIDINKTTTTPGTQFKSEYTSIAIPNKFDSYSANQFTNNYTTNQPITTGTGLGTGMGTGLGTNTGVGTGVGAGVGSTYTSNYIPPSLNNYTSTTSNQTQLFTPPSLLSSLTTTTTKPFDPTAITPLTTSITNPITNIDYKFNKQQNNRKLNNYQSSSNTTPINITNTYNNNNSQNNYKYYNVQPKQQVKQTQPPQTYTNNNNTQPIYQTTNTNANANNITDNNQNIINSNNRNTYIDQQAERDHNNNQDIQRPQFVIETFKQGSKYQGFKLRDMRHGQGKFYYQDGGMYDGNWTQNKMDGYGSLYYQSGELAYQGMWKDDQFQGKGKLFNQSPQPLQDNFNYQNFDQIDEFWEYYEGDFVQDFKKGKGKLMLSNGQYFEGTFHNDMVQGVGIFHCKNGQVIKGVWRQNHLISQ